MAGQEPEKTNELLQVIGLAVQNKVDSAKAIEEWRTKQAASNAKPTTVAATTKKIEKTTATAIKGSSKINNVKKAPAVAPPADAEKINEDLEKKPRVDSGIVEDTAASPQDDEIIKMEDNEVVPIQSDPIPDTGETDSDWPSNKNSIDLLATSIPGGLDEKQELINAIDEEADRRKKEPKKPPSRKSSSDKLLKQPPVEPSEAKAEPIKSQTVETNPSSAVTVVESVKAVVRPRTSLRPPSVRPASARPGAPRRRDRNVEVVIQPDANIQLGDINVTVEQFKSAVLNDDDDDSLIVIEDALLEQSTGTDLQGTSTLAADADNQGQLVKQILESQKEFETGEADKIDSNSGKTNKVKDHIQALTKSIQPLGKFMDFLLEDIDSMQREYDMWRDRGKEVALKLAREKNSLENTGQSLKHQLEELSIEVAEKQSSIFLIRETILQNEQKILKLFKNL